LLPPIIKTIEVPCGQQQAFKIFLEDLGRWWPGDRFSVSAFYGKPPREIHVEARAGGRIVELAHNGTEHLWGTLRTYDPYQSLSMDFHIAQPASHASLLELNFVPLGPKRTRVTLTHSGWEAFGKQAKMMMGGYLTGWTAIFEEAYLSACSTTASTIDPNP